MAKNVKNASKAQAEDLKYIPPARKAAQGYGHAFVRALYPQAS